MAVAIACSPATVMSAVMPHARTRLQAASSTDEFAVSQLAGLQMLANFAER